MNVDFSGIPGELVADAERAWAAVSALPDCEDLFTEPVRAAFPVVTACSSFVSTLITRRPDMLVGLIVSGRLEGPATEIGLRELAVRALDNKHDDEAAMVALRRFRQREMLRIAWRDLAGWADLAETMRDTSALADACINAALGFASGQMEARYGVPRRPDGEPDQMIVLALGKLGGRELNFSSDIDLVFLFGQPGTTDGQRPVDHESYFKRLGQAVIRLLDEITGDGFVFRVDTRLRPFGSTGPLAISLPAFELYLQEHGRDWERYAYVKARIVTGQFYSAEIYERILRPFVYRRYIDYGMFESLRDMKAMIEREVARRDLADDIKIGPGGIREVEFITQAFQLIRGGSEPALRRSELIPVVHHLADRGQLAEMTATELLEAYRFLRRLENRIQMLDDRQTQKLPTDETSRSRVALAMGFANWTSLYAAIQANRDGVTEHFRRILFAPDAEKGETDRVAVLANLWAGAIPGDVAGGVLEGLGFTETEDVLARLETFRNAGFLKRLDETGRRRLDKLMPRIISATGRSDAPADTLKRVLAVLESVGRRAAYFALLNENPDALARLVSLAGRSGWISAQVARAPVLLDELIDPQPMTGPPQRQALEDELGKRLSTVDPEDLERQMDVLRQFKQATVFRIAVADISGNLPLMKVSDALTHLAEAVLEHSMRLAQMHLRTRHGQPRCMVDGVRRPARFAVIAYGKLGGLELGYGSDLDLVFMHDSAGEEQMTDGERPVDNSVYFTRLGQRIGHLLSTPTTGGVLYEVDMRLRPSGRKGLLVTSAEAFSKYQDGDAWTWEHQALLRSRAVAGDPALMERFETIRRDVLCRFRDAAQLKRDVLDMRARMRAEQKTVAGTFDLKAGEGGLTDIEFLVQFWVLRSAEEHSALVEYSDNVRQLEALAAAGLIAPAVTERLHDTYISYRARVHALALEGLPPEVPDGELQPSRAFVSDQWARSFG